METRRVIPDGLLAGLAVAAAGIAMAQEAAPPGSGAPAASAAAASFLPLECLADQTGGFHDYPDDAESYQPALFNSTPFRLEENTVFMLNLADQPGVDLFVTLTAGEDPVTTELECRQVFAPTVAPDAQ